MHTWHTGCTNLLLLFLWRTSVQFSRSVVSDSLQPHESQHARPPCPSPTPGVYSNSCPSSWWCHPAISSSVVPFSSCPQQYLIHITVSFLVVKDIWYTTFYTFDSSSCCKWQKQTNKNSSFIFICVYMHASLVASVMSNSLWPYGL